MNEAQGIFKKQSKSASGILFVPSKLTSDSQFPLKPNARVKISIVDKTLVVEAAQ